MIPMITNIRIDNTWNHCNPVTVFNNITYLFPVFWWLMFPLKNKPILIFTGFDEESRSEIFWE